jgi:tetratricopeptide (TPR) repeat protein
MSAGQPAAARAGDDPEERRPPGLFFGVGTTTYNNPAFIELPHAADDVRRVGERFAEESFETSVTLDQPKLVIQEVLDDELTVDRLPAGAPLVVLWSGHAAPNLALDTVLLFSTDDTPQTATAMTLAQVAASAARTGASQILIMVDACYAGQSVIDAATVCDRVASALPDQQGRWTGVIASSQNYERAVDGAFVAKLLELLDKGPRDPTLRLRWSSYQAGLRGDDLIDAVVKEWDEDRQQPKQMSLGDPWLLLPNPLYRAGAPERVVEHLLWAARGGAHGEDGNWFTGRKQQLRTIVGWLQSAQPGLCVITGPAGCGKSALAGRIVSLSNAEERGSVLAAQGLPATDLDPGEGSVAAHIQARGLTLEGCAQLLASALKVPTRAAPNEHDILSWARSIEGPPPTIVIDGLDEAGAEASRIADELLAELATQTQLIVATREVPGAGTEHSLLQRLGMPTHRIDLSPGKAGEDSDIRAYVVERLTVGGGHPRVDSMDPELVAVEIEALAAHSASAGGDGGFLLARVLTSQLIARPLDTSADGWRSQLATTVEQAFVQDLVAVRPLTRNGVELPEAGQDLLTALAYSYGPGFPADDIWPAVATALSPTGTEYERLDAFWALDEHGRYVTASSLEGQAVYRVHHRLAESLRTSDAPGARASVARAVLAAYRAFLESGRAATDHPYLWQFAWRHAVDGGTDAIEALARLAEHDQALAPDVPEALDYLGLSYYRAGNSLDAVAPTERAVTIREQLAAEDPDRLPGLARSLNNVSNYYSQVGRPLEAVEPNERAVAIYEQLAAENPTFRNELALSLNNLGNHYNGVGRLLEAVEPTERAVDIYEQLAAENPAFLNELATSLNNLGSHYSGVGRLLEAVKPTERAVALHEQLAAENPAFLNDLATSLTSLGMRYGAVGRLQDAVEPTERAVAIREQLAGENPAFLNDLANTLTNLGIRQNQVGRRLEAVEPTERAVDIYDQLAAENPTFLNALANALTNLGNHYSGVGRLLEAVEPTERAVAIREQLASENPAFLNDLASTLTNLGNHYSGVGRQQEAVEPTERAVDIYEQLAAKNPAFLNDLITALTNLGNHYSEVGRQQEAIKPTERAIDIGERLAAENPAFLGPLASALTSLGNHYSEVGRQQEATELTERAIDIYEQLASENPAFLNDLATSLNNLGVRYREVGRLRDAVKPTERAVDIHEQLAAENPAFLDELAMSLNNLGNRYHLIGRLRDAVKPTERAVDVYEQLAAENPAFLDDLALALANLGAHYGQVGRLQEAIEPTERSVDIREQLAAENPAFLDVLATSLNNLSIHYFELGRLEDGVRAWDAVAQRVAAANPTAGATLWVRRRRSKEDIDSSITDVLEALALDAGLHPQLTGEIHTRCRDLRRLGPDRFDARWDGELPAWLLLDEELVDVLYAWMQTATWSESRAFLTANADQILTDDTKLALEELALLVGEDQGMLDGYPGLIEACRADGIDATYAPLLIIDTVVEWLAIDQLDDSATFLRDHMERLLSDTAMAVTAEKQDVVHRAILAFARADRAEEAYHLLKAPEELAGALVHLRRENNFELLGATADLAFAQATTAEAKAGATVDLAIALALSDLHERAIETIAEVRSFGTDVSPLIQTLADVIVHHQDQSADLAALLQALTAEDPPPSTNTDDDASAD